jgi:hypothetical protein
MHADNLFPVVNMLALAGWLLLIFLPRRRWATHVAAAVVIPGLLAAGYTVILLANLDIFQGGFSSLDGIAELFARRWVLLAGWMHYLAFDLFIGAWEVRDSQRLRISHRWVIPCLLMTFLAGPMGLVSYLAIRALSRGELAAEGNCPTSFAPAAEVL